MPANAVGASVQRSNSTDAFFRAWCVFIRDGFTDGGWIQTADTGQMNFTTVTRPLLANTLQGYALFRMDDALQGTAPIVVKVSFGSGSAANDPRVDVQIGTGSNGTGSITGSLITDTVRTSGSATTEVVNSYSSGSTSHIVFGMFIVAGAGSLHMGFSIERGATTAGADTGDYVVYVTTGTNQILRNISYLGSTTQSDTALTTVLTSAAAVAGATTNALRGQDIGFGLIMPTVAATATVDRRPTNPIRTFILIQSAGIVTEAQVTLYVYGAPRVYRRLANVGCSVGNNTNTVFANPWMLFE